MCGIVGVIAQDARLAHEVVPRMNAVQRHRGPDQEGEFAANLGAAALRFGFRRLAILDLSPAGHQPMVNPETGDCLVFNGEIYNFQSLRRELQHQGVKFRGHSDTEVLLHGLSTWGTDFLTRVNGMFALAFYDARRRRVLLARDPLGIKPLYTAQTGEGFLFASELRSLAASGLLRREPERAAVASYLAYGALPTPLTMLPEAREFPAGSFQWIDADVLSKSPSPAQRYWQPPLPTNRGEFRGVAENLRGLLEQVVAEHLISDVPVGVFLSAGIDSTIIAAIAVRQTSQLSTFTVGFSDDESLDEGRIAALTAHRLGTRHHDIQLPESQVLSMFADWIEAVDQPSMDGFNTYLISRVVKAQGITVALSGLGADELFGGYETFPRVPRFLKLQPWLSRLPASTVNWLAKLATLGKSTDVRQKFLDTLQSRGLLATYLSLRRVFSNPLLEQFGMVPGQLGLTGNWLTNDMESLLATRNDAPGWTVSVLESQTYMANILLRDSDAVGMANSLEIRVPYLDRRILDLVYSLTDDVRIPRHGGRKALLRQAFADYLPPAVAFRRKSGFVLPLRRWMRGPLRELCQQGIDRLIATGLIPAEPVNGYWQKFLTEDSGVLWSRALSLCMLGHYLHRITAVPVENQLPTQLSPDAHPRPTRSRC